MGLATALPPCLYTREVCGRPGCGGVFTVMAAVLAVPSPGQIPGAVKVGKSWARAVFLPMSQVMVSLSGATLHWYLS